jgi:hypothetical protein
MRPLHPERVGAHAPDGERFWIDRRFVDTTQVSARDVRMVLAGALGLMGFWALVFGARNLFALRGGLRIVVIVCDIPWILGLPLGVALLVKHPEAIRWARNYVRFFLAVVCLGIVLHHLPIRAARALPPWPLWRMVVDAATPVALWGLLAWSRSQGLQKKPGDEPGG